MSRYITAGLLLSGSAWPMQVQRQNQSSAKSANRRKGGRPAQGQASQQAPSTDCAERTRPRQAARTVSAICDRSGNPRVPEPQQLYAGGMKEQSRAWARACGALRIMNLNVAGARSHLCSARPPVQTCQKTSDARFSSPCCLAEPRKGVLGSAHLCAAAPSFAHARSTACEGSRQLMYCQRCARSLALSQLGWCEPSAFSRAEGSPLKRQTSVVRVMQDREREGGA